MTWPQVRLSALHTMQACTSGQTASGSKGKGEVPVHSYTDLARFSNEGVYKGQALKIAVLFQQLLFQKPYNSDATSFSGCLQRQLELWQDGD